MGDIIDRLRATAWRFGLLARPGDTLGHCDRCGKPITRHHGIMWVAHRGPFGVTAVQRVHGTCGDDWGIVLPISEPQP